MGMCLNKQGIELAFDWHLTDTCNFDCVYCHPQIKAKKNHRLPLRLTTVQMIDVFNRLQKTCHILMSGGEPFLYPDFVNLCAGLTQNHYITINTNFSAANVRQFALRIDPKRVLNISAAIHINERERLNLGTQDFVEKVILFQRRGFDISVNYVLYPPLLTRFEQDRDLLVNLGVAQVSAKAFKGVYEGRLYPEGYSAEQMKKILSYRTLSGHTDEYLKGLMNLKGRLCEAGRKSFKVEVDGNVRRCATVKGDYGNLYDGTIRIDESPRPCPSPRALALSWCYKFLTNGDKQASATTH